VERRPELNRARRGGPAARRGSPTARRADPASRPAPWVGLAGLAATGFLYGYTAVVTPGWVTSLLLPLLWVGLVALGVRWFLRRPGWVPLLPVLAVVVWFAAVLA